MSTLKMINQKSVKQHHSYWNLTTLTMLYLANQLVNETQSFAITPSNSRNSNYNFS